MANEAADLARMAASAWPAPKRKAPPSAGTKHPNQKSPRVGRIDEKPNPNEYAHNGNLPTKLQHFRRLNP